MKLNFETNIAEGTPEELVEYLRLVEEGDKNSDNQLFGFGHAHQPDEDTLKGLLGSLVKMTGSYTDSTELQVGDKVKVLDSASGAEGEATVTKVLKDGYVEIAGTSESGTYLTNWSSHAFFLEKIEEEPDEAGIGEFYIVNDFNRALSIGTILKKVDNHTLKDSLGDEYLHADVNEDKLMRYTFWYLDGTTFNEFVVLKATTEGYFVDSRGFRYSYQSVSGSAKPITTESVREVFEEAEYEGSLLKYFPTIDMFDKVA